MFEWCNLSIELQRRKNWIFLLILFWKEKSSCQNIKLQGLDYTLINSKLLTRVLCSQEGKIPLCKNSLSPWIFSIRLACFPNCYMCNFIYGWKPPLQCSSAAPKVWGMNEFQKWYISRAWVPSHNFWLEIHFSTKLFPLSSLASVSADRSGSRKRTGRVRELDCSKYKLSLFYQLM